MDICNEKLSSTCSETIFGIKIDNKLTLDEHVEGLCKKTSQKISAVARISSLMRFEQRNSIVNLFITSHFSHYPLVWMFHTRRLNNLNKNIHERTLKIIYQDYNTSFKELLRKDKTKINKNVLIECQKQKSICILKDLIDRSSHWKWSVRKGVPENFANFKGKHLCQSLLFNKVALMYGTNIKRHSILQVFFKFLNVFISSTYLQIKFDN